MQGGTPAWNGFRYAMCNESMQGLPFAEQCAIVAAAGYRGIELAAFTFVAKGVEELDRAARAAIAATMAKANLECAGLHWLLAPPPAGLHFTTPDGEVRSRTIAYFEKLIDFCGDLGAPVMVFGSPKQRGAGGAPLPDARRRFKEGLRRVAERARRRNVTVLVEALDRSQTDVINTLAEARALVEEIDHPAIELMFDFHNTADETEPFDALIAAHYDRIRHVHVQEMDGRHLGAGGAVETFAPGFQALKDRGYDRWVSLEVFDFAPGGRRIAEESMAALRRIEAQLV
ncbi:MAG TPA: sugar phosphate isomerase/epimerase [Planctomycetes bacterium]|nr:sugar phosphate isomerase/epimerase [Planctomycetota bacterium]